MRMIPGKPGFSNPDDFTLVRWPRLGQVAVGSVVLWANLFATRASPPRRDS